MGDNSKCVSALDDFCDEDVEKSSEIEINSSSMMVLDDNCKETESRVSGMDDENNIRDKSVVGCCGIFDKKDDEINKNAFRNFKEYSSVVMQVDASKEKRQIGNGLAMVVDKFVNEKNKSLSFEKELDVSLGSQIAAEFTESLYFSPTGIGVEQDASKKDNDLLVSDL
ncbi:hypothetical protein Tco_0350052, partial [Tanacetum coccineum]